MDLRKIKKLIEMLQESDLNEIEVKEGEESVRINRKKGDVEIPQQIVAPQVQNKKIVDNVDEPEENLSFIQSPMVGTFYRSPAPGKPPFVEIGQRVKKGDTICIIEAMKMMNQVKSEFDGKIVDIKVENGQPVEFNESLVSIETI
ncbi:MAG: acetyl-CoA carboxylase biotin carboxyl carrier protein [Pseudomonadota bacterium]|nr:acetyl-CoA carboxylase biotin carboxyl carrier protein [Pseudomonadota bacterium]